MHGVLEGQEMCGFLMWVGGHAPWPLGRDLGAKDVGKLIHFQRKAQRQRFTADGEEGERIIGLINSWL